MRGRVIALRIDVHITEVERTLKCPPGRPVRAGSAPAKTKRFEIERFDECRYHPNHVVLWNVVIQMLGKENTLAAIGSLDKTLHLAFLIESDELLTFQK